MRIPVVCCTTWLISAMSFDLEILHRAQPEYAATLPHQLRDVGDDLADVFGARARHPDHAADISVALAMRRCTVRTGITTMSS